MTRMLLCAAGLAATLSTSTAPARADDFLQQEGDMWRGSKLVGVNIYGPDHKKVGGISDVLMGKDGKVAYVVIGVGGFLGIGEKDVAIPYDKVTFSQEPMPVASGSAGAVNAPAATGAAPANIGMAPNNSAGTGTPTATNSPAMGAVPPANGTAAAAPAPSTAYPDHGTIEYSADQLKAAPTFTYSK